MNKLSYLITGVFFLLVSMQVDAQSCNYQLELWDSWGDGWNSNTIDVDVNGSIVLDDVTLGAGSQGFFNIPITVGDNITITYNGGGTFPAENSWQLLDGSGAVVNTQGGGYGLGPLSAGAPPALVPGLPVGPFTASTCPSCPSPSGMAVSVVSLTEVSLAWSAGGTETEWDIEYYEQGVGFFTGVPTVGFDDVTNNTTLPITGLTAGAVYELWYRADCAAGGGAGQSTPWVGPVTFSIIVGDDCSSAIDLDGETSPYSGTTVGAVDDFSFACNPNVSSDLIFFIDIDPNETLEIGQTTNSYDSENYVFYGPTCPGDEVAGFIACFDDSDLTLVTWTNNTGATQRVYWIQDGFSPLSNQAGAFTLAWNVVPPPACPIPGTPVISNITENSANVTWTAGDTETEWDVYYGPTPLAAANVTTDPTEDNVTVNTNFALNGLSASTSYEFYVRADCAPGDSSDWLGPIAFTTACPIFSLPFSEDFEGTGLANGSNYAEPCWTTIDGGISDWEITTAGTGSTGTGPLSGSDGGAYVFFETSGGSTGDQAELITPQIDLPGGSAPLLSFDYFMFGATVDVLNVDIDAGGGYVNLFTVGPGQQQTSQTDAWITEGIDLCAYAGSTVNIRFVATRGGSFTGDIAIDQVTVEDFACPTVGAITVDNILDVSADVSWVTGSAPACAPAVSYTVDVQDAGVSIGAPYPLTVTGNSASLTGLTLGTEYAVIVAPVCNPASGNQQNFQTLNCLPGDRCSYTLTLFENGLNGINFDGWVTGAAIRASTGGNSADYTIDPDTYFGPEQLAFNILACPGDSLTFEVIGSFQNSGETWSVTGPGGLSYNPVDPTLPLLIGSACPTCVPAFNLSATDICEGSVTLNWSDPGTPYDSVEVSWSRSIFGFPTAGESSGIIVGNPSSYTFAAVTDFGLDPITFGLNSNAPNWPADTQIDYQIIGYCGSELSQASGSFTTPSCSCAEQCSYTVTVGDAFGDGWDSNDGADFDEYIRVLIDGTPVDSVTPVSNAGFGPDLITIGTCPGANISFEYVANGDNFTSEVIYNISSSIAGTLVDVTAGTFLDGADLNGTIFSETACPSCLSPTDLAAINIASDSARVVWTDASGEGSHSYNIVESGQDPLVNGTWVATADTTFLANGLLSNTTYDVYVGSLCALDNSDTVSVSFSTPAGCGSTGVTYCYGDGAFTPVEIATYTVNNPGDWIEISFTAGVFEVGFDAITLWDDAIGGNAIFGPFEGNLTGTTVTSSTGTIVMSFTSDGSFSCAGNGTQAQTVYDIVCFPPPQCFDVIDVTVTNVTDTEIEVAWTDTSSLGNVDQYIVTVTDTTNAGSAIVQNIPVGTTTATFSGLNSAAVHSITIQTDCTLGGDGLANGTALTYATTLPQQPSGVTCSTGLPTFVYIEEFEAANPNGWAGNLGGGNGTWDFGTSGNTNSTGTGPFASFSGGTHLEYEGSGNSSATAEVYSPAIDLSQFAANGSAELSLYFHAYGLVPESFGQFDLQISTDSVNFDTLFTWVGALQTADTDPWVAAAADISAYVGAPFYIRLSNFGSGVNFYSDFSVDLLRVEMCSEACLDPSDLSVTTTSETETTLDWVENGDATTWSVEWGEGATQGAVGNDTIAVTGTPTTDLTGLTAGTTYYYWVQSDCGVDSSDWVGPFSWVQPIEGDNCDLPFVITSIPFSSGAVNTGFFSDTYSTSPCNGSYMGGNDVVFSYTPSVDTCISVSFDAQSTWLGLHILDGCPDDGGATCLVPDGATANNDDLFASGAGIREVNTLFLTGGTEYFFVVSTFPAPQTGIFELSLGGCPACLPPSDLAVDNSAGNAADISFTSNNPGVNYSYAYGLNGFTIGVDEIGSGGGGPTTGSEAFTISSLSGSTTYQVCVWEDCDPINPGDGGSDTVCVSFTTPLLNDDCANAETIACNDLVIGNTSTANPSTIGAFTGANESARDVWYTFVGQNSDDLGALPGTPGDQVTLSTCNDGGATPGSASYDTKIDVYTGSCGTPVFVGGNDDGGGCSGFSSLFSFPTTVGETYLVRVYGFGAFSSGAFAMSVECSAPCLPAPLNDECSSPEVLALETFAVGPYTTGFNTCAASETFNPSCDLFGTIQGVWYEFTTDASGEVRLSLDTMTMDGTAASLVHYVLYDVAPCDGTPAELDCQDLVGVASYDVTYLLSASTTYKVLVYTNDVEAGSFRIRVTGPPPPPVNDECAGAVLLTIDDDCSTPTAGTLEGATETASPAVSGECGPQINGVNDVWYKAVIPASGRVVVDFPTQPGSNMYTELYTGSNCSLTYLGSSCSAINPKIYPLPGADISEQLTGGDTLYIRVWDQLNDDEGPFEICLLDPVPANNDCAASVSVPVTEYGVSSFVNGNTRFSWSGDDCTGANNADEQVWFNFTATRTQHLIYTGVLAGSGNDYDAVIQVYDACGGTLLGCFDNYGAGDFERVYIDGLTVGNTYIYSVHHSGGAQDATSQAFRTGVREMADTRLRDADCNQTGYVLGQSVYSQRDDFNEIYTNPVIFVRGYGFRFVQQGGGLDIAVQNNSVDGFYQQLDDIGGVGLQYGETYDVTVQHLLRLNVNGAQTEVWSDFGPVCTITMGTAPTTSLQPQYCTGLDDYVLADQLQATPIVGGDSYRFTFVGGGDTYVYTSANYAVSLFQVGGGALEYGVSYDVTVEVLANGTWGPPGPPCTIFMATQPENTQVSSSFCNGSYLYPQSNFILADQVLGATAYEFRFDNGLETLTEVKAGVSFQFHTTSLVFTPGIYNVDVRASAGGQWSDFVNACPITILPLPEFDGGPSDDVADGSDVRSIGIADISLNMYPNPNSGDAVFVNLNGMSDDAQRIRVEVIDLTGKVVYYDEMGNNGSEANFIMEFAEPLSKGMYFVNLYVDDSMMVEKLTVE